MGYKRRAVGRVLIAVVNVYSILIKVCLPGLCKQPKPMIFGVEASTPPTPLDRTLVTGLKCSCFTLVFVFAWSTTINFSVIPHSVVKQLQVLYRFCAWQQFAQSPHIQAFYLHSRLLKCNSVNC